MDEREARTDENGGIHGKTGGAYAWGGDTRLKGGMHA
jgi:hypothetical protein